MERYEVQQPPEANHADLREDLLQQAQNAEHDPHFELIDIDKLTDQDLDMYDLLRRGELTQDILSEYERSLRTEHETEENSAFSSPREEFAAYLRNKLIASIADQRRHQEH